MYWLLLFFAGMLEIVWAVGIKYTEGFTKLLPSIFTIVAMVLSMALLSFASRNLPLGTAYAVWTGIGAVGTVVIGILIFKEPATFWRLVFLFTLIGSIVGLKAVSA